METINLAEFDIMGVFTLEDVAGIEKYVTKVSSGEYLSRSREYYEPKTFTKLSFERGLLNSFLTSEPSRRNFVILENMLNASAKVYYESLKKHILYGEQDVYIKARCCLKEDVVNVINALSGADIKKASYKLPLGNERAPERAIELDNKALLYIFCRTVDISKDVHILTPGYGSLYLGPFMKTMHGTTYSNLLKSSYIRDQKELTLLKQKKDIFDLVSNVQDLQLARKVVLLDDNVGTGQTMREIKSQLQQKGISVSCGAVQYNWINRFRYFQGEKDTTFDVRDFDYITPLNYPGHKLMEHAIENLKLSGDAYVCYLKSKSYRNYLVNDFVGSVARSELYTDGLRFNLYKNKDLSFLARRTNLAMKQAILELSCKNWLDKYKVRKHIKAFQKYFYTTIAPIEENFGKDENRDGTVNHTNSENLNKIAQIRKKIAKNIDGIFDTKLEKKKFLLN